MKILFQDCFNKHVDFIKARTSIYGERPGVTRYKKTLCSFVKIYISLFFDNFACKFIDDCFKKSVDVSYKQVRSRYFAVSSGRREKQERLSYIPL